MNKIKQILKSKFRTGLKTLPYIAIALLVGVTAVYATNKLTPSGNAVIDQMYSLTDIYNLATDGTPAEEKTGDITPTPTGEVTETSIPTLSDVYTALSTEIAKLSPNVIKVGTTAFGKIGAVSAGTPAPTFASADQTTYSCEALAVDPAQPAVTLQTICGYNSGCSWSGSTCTGGTKTPSGGHMTWYAATASCAEKSDEGSSSWQLPTNIELLTYYMDNNDAGNPPTGFVGGYYWSGTTGQYPESSDFAYSVDMSDGSVGNAVRYFPDSLARCAH